MITGVALIHRDRRGGDGGDSCHHRQRRGGGQLRHHRRGRDFDREPGHPHRHGQQPDPACGRGHPPLTYTFSGLVNGDTTSVISGTPSLSTTATIVSPVGQYPITIAVGTLIAANYGFTTVGGSLTSSRP